MTIPKSWRATTLGDECEIVSGSTPKTKERSYWDGEIPWLTPADLSNWQGVYIDGGSRYITKEGLNSCPARLFPPNTVMMSSRAPIGYTAIASREMCTNQGFKSMLPSPTIHPEWLRYFIEHALPEIKAMASGTTFAEISGKKLATLPLLLPPIEEQKRIVETLDSHLAKISQIKRILLETSYDFDKLLRSVLHNFFNQASDQSKIVNFSDFFDVVQPKQSGYKQKDYKENGILPIVDQGKSLVGGYTDELERRIKVTDALVIFGDHTLCTKYIDFDFALGADGTKILKSKTGVNPRFAYLQLRSKEIRSKGYARHMGELRKEHFWLPSVENQILVAEQVDDLLDQLEVAKSELTQQSVLLDSLKRSILHKAFTGQLTKENE